MPDAHAVLRCSRVLYVDRRINSSSGGALQVQAGSKRDGNCTAVIRVFHESMHSMHGNYPDACKISMHVKSVLQTRIMHGFRLMIRLNQGYFIDFRCRTVYYSYRMVNGKLSD